MFGKYLDSRRPVCYWADIYKQLAKAPEELVDLEVEFNTERYEVPYVYLSCDSYFPSGRLKGTE
jgi:hypothetical protein